MAEKQWAQQGYSATPLVQATPEVRQSMHGCLPADVGLFKIPDGLTDEQVLFSPISSPLATWLQKTARLSLATS